MNRARLDTIAQLRDRNVTDEVRLAIDAWIEAPKADPALQQRAQAAREEIEREASTKRDAIAAIFDASGATPKASRPRTPGNGGTTFGEVFVTTMSTKNALWNCPLMEHEARHSAQWAGWGAVSFAASYYLGMAHSFASTGDGACGNYFEIDAGLLQGNYSC